MYMFIYDHNYLCCTFLLERVEAHTTLDDHKRLVKLSEQKLEASIRA
jgi:hypothetical protein